MSDVKDSFNLDPESKKLLLNYALDIRKFEIDLYWKRATYFWAFIAVIFAGYFAILSSDSISEIEQREFEFMIGCIGFVFSLAWYFVNRGSKFWQENWEAHASIHEDDVIGPLFKTTIKSNDFCAIFTKPFSRYGFSVSKINIILSLFVTFIWLFLTIRSFNSFNLLEMQNTQYSYFNIILVLVLAISTVILFLWKGRTSQGKKTNVFIKRDEENILD